MIPTEPNGSTAIVLSPDENRILKEVLKPGAKIEVILPAEASAEELWRGLEIFVKGANWFTNGINTLHPIIGKVLLRFKEKPSLYKSLGYDNFADFKYKGVGARLGLKRSALFDVMRLAEQWAQVTPERYVKIGPTKINLLSQFATGASMNAEELLQKAETMTVTQLREWAEDEGELLPGQVIPKTIHIQTTLEVYRHWVGFCRDEDVQAWAESSQPDRILQALLMEYQIDAFNKGAGKIAERKEQEKDDAIRSIDVPEVPDAGAEGQSS